MQMRFPSRWCLAILLLTASAAAAPAQESREQEVSRIFAGAVPQGLDDLRDMQVRIKQVAEKAIATTVAVRVGAAHGSGVVISKDGYVLTAGHVIGSSGRTAFVTFADGTTVQGRTLGRISGNRGGVVRDSGLLKIIEPGDWPIAEMGDSSTLRPGQWCLATGHPGGYQEDRKPVVRLGRVLTTNSAVISTDCTLIGGDSGGPLFDMDGKVIGIHSRIGEQLTENMHVPVNRYRNHWDQLAMLDGASAPDVEPGAPYVGIESDTSFNRAEITAVRPDSPADKAGLLVGDVIVAVDGRPVPNFSRLVEIVRAHRPGDVLILSVLRGGETNPDNAVGMQLRIGSR